MFCTELVTGVDDFGKVIFLQSTCDRARGVATSREAPCCAYCREQDNTDAVAQQAAYDDDEDEPPFGQAVRALLEAPIHPTNVFPLR